MQTMPPAAGKLRDRRDDDRRRVGAGASRAAPQRGTEAAYARHRGCSRQSVSVALRDGRIRAGPDGLIDFAAADRAWERNTDLRKPANTVNGQPKHAAPRRGAKPADATLHSYQVRREAAKAEREERDLAKDKGDFVERERVKIRWGERTRKARQQLEALPDRLSGQLAAITDPVEVHRILREEIRAACSAIADEEDEGE